ncbi:MAG: hypothetical protein EOO99_02850 [Pedobacter sp.]|nr:MAG: hypothetical protein EOO99_02850 [Pedobacter sp.]
MFIFCSIIVPFFLYCVIYYAPKIRNEPFKAKEFVSLKYAWGVGSQLDNHYDSATGQYVYLDNQDSLVSKKILLTEKNTKYLDSIADLQGFWNLPSVMANQVEDTLSTTIPRYIIEFKYKRKTKRVLLMANFENKERMVSAGKTMQKTIAQLLIDLETKTSKDDVQ